jgi:hypothetical protein
MLAFGLEKHCRSSGRDINHFFNVCVQREPILK